MTQGERIREVRKALGLTLEKFGEKIGMKKNSVSQLENGKNSVTEQVVKAICREYNVNYMWLTTGDGEMFIDTDDDFIERIDRIMAGEDEARKSLFKFMLELSDEDIAALDRLMKKAIEFTQNNKEKD
jgi:transcriptional regulator with XRE-family HTH domain